MSEKPRPASIEAPKKFESKETQELFKASLGFDFIFTKDKTGQLHGYCLEINGHDSGIRGMEEIPKGQIDKTHKIVAGIRATVNPEMARKYRIANEILKDIRSGEFNPSKEGRQQIEAYLDRSLRTKPTFTHAHHNPIFIENITRDKRLQEKYIPRQYLPRTWHENESPTSSTGAWVVKRAGSRGGNGVTILSNEQFEDFIERAGESAKNVVAQEYIQSAGAQAVPDSVGRRAASMRLLIDFRYCSDGTIPIDFMTGYQRVSPHDMEYVPEKGYIKPLRKGGLIVSMSNGAIAAPASEEEMSVAFTAAEEIIQNITIDYLENALTMIKQDVLPARK